MEACIRLTFPFRLGEGMCLASEFLGLEILVIAGSRTCLTWLFQKPIFSTRRTEPRGTFLDAFCCCAST